jgi:hypothetical protein
MASPKKRQRHFPTRTAVAAFPTARPPLTFSGSVAACHGILQRGDASPRARHSPAVTFSHAPHEATPARLPLPLSHLHCGCRSPGAPPLTRGRTAARLRSFAESVCFECVRGMLQVFHMDIVKVDRDIAYVAMVVHICCKLLFLMFHLFFQTYFASVFMLMLYMFHTYVASVIAKSLRMFCNDFKVFFSVLVSVLDVYFKCFICLSDACCKCCIWITFKSRSGVAHVAM